MNSQYELWQLVNLYWSMNENIYLEMGGQLNLINFNEIYEHHFSPCEVMQLHTNWSMMDYPTHRFGFLFSPMLPLFMNVILLLMFYIKKVWVPNTHAETVGRSWSCNSFVIQYSVMWNLKPEDDLFRGSTVMFLSILVLSAVYVFAISLVGYAIIGYTESVCSVYVRMHVCMLCMCVYWLHDPILLIQP